MHGAKTLELPVDGRDREAVSAMVRDLESQRIDRRGALIAGIAAGLSFASLSALGASRPDAATGDSAEADALP